MKKYEFLTQELLLDLYITQNKSRSIIAKELNIPERVVKTYLSKFGIKKPKELQQINNKKLKATLGKHWWNNGIQEVYSEDCPEGFVSGMLKSRVEKMHKNWKLTKNGLKVLQENGKNSKGRKHTEETKLKISNHWKTIPHPLKGKVRSKETCIKISNKLKGHYQIAPKRDKLEALTETQLYTYLNEDKTINFPKIYEELEILNNQDSWQQIFNCYDKYGIKYKRNIAVSIFEKEVYNYIKSIYKGKIEENKKHFLNGLEVDIYIPEYKVAIECNGVYWHQTEFIKNNNRYLYVPNSNFKLPDYHFKKSKAAFDKGIRLIHIWEDQWKDPKLNSLLKAILKGALNISLKEKPIYARNCIIKEIPLNEYTDFCNKYHTQNSRYAEIRLGLYYEDKLVQLASFHKMHSNNHKKSLKDNYEYEWIRGCTGFDHSRVIGGVSKLFKYFVNKYNPESILCYSDFNLFNGKGYKECGFELMGFTKNDKFYVDKSSFKRINRNAKKYREYMQKVIDKKWLCCYGAGSLKFVWKKESAV